MSRCFPFPPPGYENTTRPNDVNLIIKEKDKHKRHKKDKDKKERSERKDKERAEGKHKEDKERSQKKNRDKKEKKKSSGESKKFGPPSENQNGKKPSPDNKPGKWSCDDGILVELGKRVGNSDAAADEKHKFLEEKKIVAPLENQNGEKPGSDVASDSVEMGKRVRNGDEKDSKKEKRKYSEGEKKIVVPPFKNSNGAHVHRLPVEMGKRVRNEGVATDTVDKRHKSLDAKIYVGPSENQNGEKLGLDNKQGDMAYDHRISVEMAKGVGNDNGVLVMANKKEKHKPSEEKNIVGPLENRNGKNTSLYNKPSYEALDHKILVEMGKRVRDDDGATDKSYPITSNYQSLGADAISSGNNWVGNFSGEKQIKVENGTFQANWVDKKREEKEKTELGNTVGKGDGLNDENRDKKKKEDKKRKKKEKKERKEKRKSKEKIKQRSGDCNLLDSCADKPADLLNESWDKQGKLPELKEQPVLNGVLHYYGTRPGTTSMTAISSRHGDLNRNGFHHPAHRSTIIPLATETQQVVITNQTVSGSKLLSPQLEVSGSKLLSPQLEIKNVRNIEPGPTANNSIKNHAIGNGSHSLIQNGRKMGNKEFRVNGVLEVKKAFSPRPSSTKHPPHPDSKYLSQILTVPKLELTLLSDDDQDWLVGCKDAKRAEFRPSLVECTERVWAEAVQLETADVIAMPYVNIF